jgi:hypothetical protein
MYTSDIVPFWYNGSRYRCSPSAGFLLFTYVVSRSRTRKAATRKPLFPHLHAVTVRDCCFCHARPDIRAVPLPGSPYLVHYTTPDCGVLRQDEPLRSIVSIHSLDLTIQPSTNIYLVKRSLLMFGSPSPNPPSATDAKRSTCRHPTPASIPMNQQNTARSKSRS